MRTAIILAAIIIAGHQDDVTSGESVAMAMMFVWDVVEMFAKMAAFGARR